MATDTAPHALETDQASREARGAPLSGRWAAGPPLHRRKVGR